MWKLNTEVLANTSTLFLTCPNCHTSDTNTIWSLAIANSGQVQLSVSPIWQLGHRTYRPKCRAKTTQMSHVSAWWWFGGSGSRVNPPPLIRTQKRARMTHQPETRVVPTVKQLSSCCFLIPRFCLFVAERQQFFTAMCW